MTEMTAKQMGEVERGRKKMNIAFIMVAVLGIGFIVTEKHPKVVQSAKQSVVPILSPNSTIEWEHGYKTSRVIATRIRNDEMGQFVQLEFPQNAYDSDRSEVSDFIESKGGWVFEGGGYPGAPAYVKFKDAKDVLTLNTKLQEVLPPLSSLLADISAGKKISPIVNPNAKIWPDTDPPDKTDKYWEFNNNANINGVAYKKAEISPGKWQWVEDRKSNKLMADMEKHRRDLYFALTHRVITDAELKEALQYGSSLNIQPMVPYYAEEKANELQRAFQLQETLRRMAKVQ